MAYTTVGDNVVDFSQGACGFGRYQPYANGGCRDLPSGGTLPWFRGPFDSPGLPGGDAAGWRHGGIDFSGGSCGGGMVRPCPTCPCTQQQAGLTTGGRVLSDFTAASLFPIAAVGIGLWFLLRK